MKNPMLMKSVAIGVLIGIAFTFMLALVMLVRSEQKEPKAPPQESRPPIEYGPDWPADTAPTLDYEAMAGLDPQTQQTNRERERNNDLEWRVEKLEAEVRSLNQIVRGIREVRIGESGPPTTTEGSEE